MSEVAAEERVKMAEMMAKCGSREERSEGGRRRGREGGREVV